MKKNFKLALLTVIFTLALFTYESTEKNPLEIQSILACKDCR